MLMNCIHSWLYCNPFVEPWWRRAGKLLCLRFCYQKYGTFRVHGTFPARYGVSSLH